MDKELKNELASALADLVIKQVLNHFLSKLPFLGVWPLSLIANKLITKIVYLIFTETELAIMFFKIDHEVSKESREYSEALEKLKTAKSPQDMAKVKDEIINKARNLIKFT